jgi:DNA-binding PadR family transcriptional regulator
MTKAKITMNLIGNYKSVKKSTKNDYKAEYNRMFPTKMSSSSFLSLYTLFLLDKKAEPLYGKEILRELESAVSVYVWKPSHGTHYPVLKALMKDGYIENVKTISDKKYYAITESGTEELQLRLAEFRPMLIESSKFFSHILTDMYNEVEDKAVTTKTMRIEDKP